MLPSKSISQPSRPQNPLVSRILVGDRRIAALVEARIREADGTSVEDGVAARGPQAERPGSIALPLLEFEYRPLGFLLKEPAFDECSLDILVFERRGRSAGVEVVATLKVASRWWGCRTRVHEGHRGVMLLYVLPMFVVYGRRRCCKVAGMSRGTDEVEVEAEVEVEGWWVDGLRGETCIMICGDIRRLELEYWQSRRLKACPMLRTQEPWST